MGKRRIGSNPEIERKIEIILAMPEPPKKIKLSPLQTLATNAIGVLEKFDNKIDKAIYFNR